MPRFNYRKPRNRKTGCHKLPRRLPAWKVCKNFEENLQDQNIDPLTPSEWKPYIGKIVLRPKRIYNLDQDGDTSCATGACCQTTMITREYEGQERVKLNPLSLFRQVNHGQNRGSNIGDNMRAMQKVGALPEEFWPRSMGWKREPPKGWQEVAAFFRIDEEFWIKTVNGFATALLMPDPVEYGRRGHAITAVDLMKNFAIRFANSWGNWGDDGFGIDNLMRDFNIQYGAFAVRSCVDSTGWRAVARRIQRRSGMPRAMLVSAV